METLAEVPEWADTANSDHGILLSRVHTTENRPTRPIHICMFVRNMGLIDPRVTREAEVGVQAGFRVTVFATQGDDERPPLRQVQRGVTFIRPEVRPSKVVNWIRKVFGTGGRTRAAGRTASEIPPNASTGGPATQGLLQRVLNHLWVWRRDFLYALQAVPLALATKADVYHAHDFDRLAIAWICSRLSGRPLVYDSHELWIDLKKMRHAQSRLETLRMRVTERALVSQCALVVTVSQGLRDILCARYHPRRIMVLRNCPRKGINGSVPRRDEARAACGIGPQDKVVLYQGYILLHRGLGTVIGAAALVPECLFLLIGPDSPYCVGLRHLVQEQRIGNVLFMGHKDERERNLYMAAADLGVAMIQDGSLSYRYSFANKNSEYLMNGLPVLASDLPEHRRVLCRTGAAILADPESASDVARAIREFFRLPPDLRRGMRQRARQAALDELNMETQMGPLLEFYKNVGKRS